MAEASLTMVFASLEAIEGALDAATTGIAAEAGATRAAVDVALTRWDRGTASRSAQLGYDAELTRSVQELTEALTRLRSTVADVRQSAHDAEVRNVAIMD